MKNLILAIFCLSASSALAGEVHDCEVSRNSTRIPSIGSFYINKGAQFILELRLSTDPNEPSGSGEQTWDVIALKRDYSDMSKLRFTGEDKGRQFSALVTNATENPIGRGDYEILVQGFRSGNRNRDGVVTHNLTAHCRFVSLSNDN